MNKCVLKSLSLFIVCLCTTLLYYHQGKSFTALHVYAEAKASRESFYSVVDSKRCNQILQQQNLTGYLKFPGLDQLKLCCDSCAFVSSSGQSLGKKAGNEIDSRQCVVRDNSAPFVGFENDVGSRTDIRMISHTSAGGIINYLKNSPAKAHELTNTTFVFWGPDKKMIKGGQTYKHMASLKSNYPSIKLYALTPTQMQFADDTFEKETGRPRMTSGSYLSTGWFTMLLLREICAETHVYGMVNETYCEDMKKNNLTDALYHYYSEKDGRECNMYFRHEGAHRGGHRFITEKRVFQRWSKIDQNIFFHSPEWS